MKIPNVILYPDSIHSACSFWRAAGPFLELSRQGEINLQIGSYSETWTTLRAFDIAVFQRPVSKDCLTQIAYCKDMKLRIVIDLDDHNEIPETHVAYDHYSRVYDEDTFIKIMMMADLVLTTTPYLKSHYSMYSRNVHVVPNAINDYWLKGRALKKTKTVFLRAGDHHEHDIYEYKDSIIGVMNSFPDWTLEVCGSNPIFLQQEVKNYVYAGDYNIHDYFAYILQSKASIFIVPLSDNKLNYAKSNISWQEATLSGAASLTPEWFLLNDVSVDYNDESSFSNGLINLIEQEDFRSRLHEASLIKLKEEYLLSKVNIKRLELIKSVL